jgi:dethiobiotin synthase
MTFVLVTGTSTGVGKTVATAAMAVALGDAGLHVGVVKPVQTGADGAEPTDAEVVRELSGLGAVWQLASFRDPLAPDTAARLRRLPTVGVAELAERTVAAADGLDVVLVEGAGGVLVRLDTDGGTIVDLGGALSAQGHRVTSAIVTTLALGTLNHTELTAIALRSAGVHMSGLVVGSQPAALELAEDCNRTELPRITGLPILGVVPAGAGLLNRPAFRAAAPGWMPDLHIALGLTPGQ